MSRRPIPPHGSEARYKGSTKRPPCRCRTCITGWTRAGQKRLLGQLAGRPASVPAGPVTAHLNDLYAANMTAQQIADLSGVDVSTVRGHAAGKFLTLRRTTSDKVLAVRPGQKALEGWVSSLGAVRRCQALYTLGHGAKAISESHPILSLRTIEYLVCGKRRNVTVAIHNAVCDTYRVLSQTPGASSQAKLRAQTAGWPGPLAWEDIDDPRSKPEGAWKSRSVSGARRKVHADPARVADLTAQGMSAEQIAQQIGCHKRTVVRIRSRVAGGLAVAA